MQLTAAQEKYLWVIYDLTLDNEDTSVTKIADRAGVSKASASVAVQWLWTNGLVLKREGKRICLSQEGNRQAVLSCGKREVIHRFLTEVLGVDGGMADEEAQALELIVSVDTLCALCRFTRQKQCDGRCEAGCGVCSQGKA